QPDPQRSPKSEYARFTQLFVNAQANLQRSSGKPPRKLGSATSDLVFVPVASCRIIDTRNTGAVMNAGATVNFYFYSDGSTPATWQSQGGSGGSVAAACPGTTLMT